MKRGLWEKLPPHTAYLLEQEYKRRNLNNKKVEWYTSEVCLHTINLTKPGIESYCINVEDYLKGWYYSGRFIGAAQEILNFIPRSES